VSTITEGRNADEVALALLVQSLADLEPNRSGWTAADLPELHEDAVQLICRIRSVDVTDQLVKQVGDFVELKAEGHNPAVILPGLIEGACRRAIFHEVQEECARREEFDAIEAQASDAYRWAAI
jgi:hypothetical protein